jgi:ElaB/YqjD/DUF883 family membrane-anchored ribosome-binding protein
MNGRITDMEAALAPKMDEIRAAVRQEAEVARERFDEGKSVLTEYVVKEPVKALAITLCVGVILGWLIKRP